MPLFRLLHASDFHFARDPDRIGVLDWWRHPHGPGPWPAGWVPSHSRVCADRFAEFVLANRDSLDAVVISGDLATTGDGGDLRVAYRYVSSPAVSGPYNAKREPTLSAANRPVPLIPGNHDRFRRWHFPGGRRFDRIFRGYWQAGQGAQRLWVKERAGAKLVLLGADFTLLRGDSFSRFYRYPPLGEHLGQGRVRRRPLAALRRLTAQARAEHRGCVLLWVIHFDPLAAERELGLRDEHLLADALRNEPVDAILCGHTHRSEVKTFAGVPLFVCGTTAEYAAARGNCFHILEIEVQPGVNSPKFVCQPYFFADQPPRFEPQV